MHLPPPPLSDGPVRDVKLELRPISNEFVASSVPEPDRVIARMPAHVIVDAAPTETVATLPPAVDEAKPDGALDVPVILSAPETVVVTVCGKVRVFPLPMVMDPNVFVPLIPTGPLVLLSATVNAPYVCPPPARVRLLEAPAKATVAFENVAVRFVVVVTSKIVPVFPVIVHVPLPMLMVRVPEPLKLTKLVKVIFGLLVLNANVPVNAPAVRLRKLMLLIVPSGVTTPPPDDPLNVIASPAAGAAFVVWHPVAAPPLVGAQLVIDVLFQGPVPPTQKQLKASAD